jgi:formamidopyrimidine-DNA glycosylase
MPELPDLEVFSRNLNKELRGKTLKKVTVANDKKLNVSKNELKKSLEGKALNKIYREGKELYFEFEHDTILSIHLMLHGKLYFFKETNGKENTIIELLFDNDTGLALTDFQGAATPALNPKLRNAPDALSKEVDFNFLKDKLTKKRTTIKNFLLDQNIIRGVGNAYADEILWDARISPFSVCNKIPDNKIKVLVKSIKTVLQDAEKKIIKTHPDIIAGEVRDFLNIHNAGKRKSPTGSSIRYETVSSRKTYYTDEQELFK